MENKLIDEALGRAIDSSDASLAAHVADRLRYTGMTYAQIFSRAQTVRPGLQLATWEALMYEADEMDVYISEGA